MTLALSHKSRKRRGWLVLAAVLAVFAASGASLAPWAYSHAIVAEPVSGGGIVPVPLSSPANPVCSELDTTYGGGQTWLDDAKVNGVGGALTNGDYDLGGGKSVTIANAGVNGSGIYVFDWSSNFGVDAVLVKQANDAHNLYVYAPTANSPEATSDTGLGPQPGQNEGGISHVSFCYDTANPASASIIIKKVVVGEDSTDAFAGTVTGTGFLHNFTGLTEQPGDEVFLDNLDLGDYDVVETPVPAAFDLLGYDFGTYIDDVVSCPEEPSLSPEAVASLEEDGQTVVVCIYNQRGQVLSDSTLIVKKIVTDGQDAPVDFTGDVTGLALSDWALNHDESAIYPGISAGDYTVNEDVPGAGYALVGFEVVDLASSTAPLTCPDPNAQGFAPAATGDVTVGESDVKLVCVYNEPVEETRQKLIVKKVVTDGQAAPSDFTGEVLGLANSDWALNHNDFTTFDDIATGDYTVVEDNPAPDYSILGYYVVTLANESPIPVCVDPAQLELESTGDVTIGEGETKLVCVYNEPAEVLASGTLIVKKIVTDGQDAPADFTGDVIGLANSDWALNHEDFEVYPGIGVGNYIVDENNPGPAFDLVGYRVVTLASTTVPLICPDPDAPGFTTNPTGAVSVADGEVKLVCVYNEPIGRLIIKKVNLGGADADVFTADIAGGHQNIPFSEATPSAYIDLPGGVVTVSEDAKAGYTYEGFSLYAGDNVTCGSAPNGGNAVNVQVTIEARATTTLCFYNLKQPGTPTPTPTTPTSTPTSTPTPTQPPQTPTASPTTPTSTPTESVAGVKTPGAPAAGTGMAAQPTSDTATASILVALAAFLIVTGTLGALAANRAR